MGFQPWINKGDRYLEIVMDYRVYCRVLSSKHTQLKVLGVKASCNVSHTCVQCVSDIFLLLPLTCPTSMIHSVPSGFWVIPLSHCSHVFPLSLKDPHPPFCLADSSPLDIKAHFKLPLLTSLHPPHARSISCCCGSESRWATLTWQWPRVQGNSAFLYVSFFQGQILSSLRAKVTGILPFSLHGHISTYICQPSTRWGGWGDNGKTTQGPDLL